MTDSGLSMVDWKPISGIIPPLTEADWYKELWNYRSSPEYQKINKGMELNEFKKIFYWEYIHRVIGRVIGLVFLVPLVFFSLKRQLDFKKIFKLTGIFALGGLQGVIGWWMVKSGLVDNPHVSHFRLATHLSLALIIFGLLFWQALGFYLSQTSNKEIINNKILENLNYKCSILFLLIFIQIIFGAFVAGLDAGMAYNTWPMMNEYFIPEYLLKLPIDLWFSHSSAVQFIHRWFAFFVFLYSFYFFLKILRAKKIGEISGKLALRLKKSSSMLFWVITLQVVIGIFTLLYQVPISLASLHQIMAVVIIGNIVYIKKAISLINLDQKS